MVLGEFAEDGMHPGRGEPDILDEFTALVGRKCPLQVLAPLRCQMLSAYLAKSLDQEAA